MQTTVIEYSKRNASSVQQILDGLTSSGLIKIKKSAKEKHLEEFKQAVRETEAMAADIRKNGTAGYKTLQELLAEE
jgi:predicted transcriptional regulator